MTTSNVIVNAGNFFVADVAERLANSDIVTAAQAAEMFEQLCEHFERHHAHLNDEATAAQVGFFLVNRALHILGYTHSHNEPLNDEIRVEYTLFNSADAFKAHVGARGTNAFFNGAVGVGKLAAWSADLDAPVAKDNGEDGEPAAADLDNWLNATNLQWAILTNGRIWRLFHKNTVKTFNTYAEVNLLDIIENKDVEAFRIFASAFCAKAITADKSGACADKKLLG